MHVFKNDPGDLNDIDPDPPKVSPVNKTDKGKGKGKLTPHQSRLLCAS